MAGQIKTVGIAGLGLIGISLAKRLLAAGFDVFGHDVNPGRNAALAVLGGTATAAPGEMGRKCGVIIISVLDTAQVEAVVEGAASANPMNLTPDNLVIGTSTCDPERIAAMAKRIQSKGLRFLEVPLSGNSDQIALGNGVGLMGGSQADVDAAAPVLDVICPQRYYLGPVGSGGRAKLAVNLVGGLNRAVMAEGLAFAESLGLDPLSFLEVLKGSAAYSRTMDNRGKKMALSDFTPHAKLSQSRKDFMLMHEAAKRSGQALPLATVYMELIEGCLAHDEGELDNSAIIKEIRRRRHAKK